MTTPCSAVAPTAQKTALLVASGSDVDELLTNVLASEGWSIQRVVDNQHILALARAKPFDLIVTGRETRVAEDVELLRKIRSARPHVRLIILTDKFTPGDVISAMREGTFSYSRLHLKLRKSPKWCVRPWQSPVGTTASKSFPGRPRGSA